MKRRVQTQFTAEELAVVLSHYDLGTIESITPFARGSRRSPKVGVVCERGKFLLKKRDKSRGGQERIAFSHTVQNHLVSKGFALPALIYPKGSSDPVVRHEGGLYELFDFVPGHPYTGKESETRDAGSMLAKFHEAMADFPIEDTLVRTGYHDASAVETGLNAIPAQVSSHDSAAGRDAEILGVVSYLFEAYAQATAAVEAEGYALWAECIVHSDWHPGNLVFKRDRVLAAIDYDCAKTGKAMCDVANGALQFSMLGRGDPAGWPDHLDVTRLRGFVAGYDGILELPESQARALPHLMIEALIAESVLPVAATGSFGPFAGFGFLGMIRRKVAWIRSRVRELTVE